MKRCTKCAMPDTRPGSIFDDAGVCQACRNYEARQSVDWAARWLDLVRLCDRHRMREGDRYDCIIPVSGGKDSHALVHIMKRQLGMNPLLLTVGNPFTWSEAGLHNFHNIGEAFSCDHLLFTISPEVMRRVVRIEFEELGNPLKLVESACYTVSLQYAVKLGIPLVVFGEDPEFEYGTTSASPYSATTYIMDGRPCGIFEPLDFAFWKGHGIERHELNAFILPPAEDVARVKPEILFMSYFVPWSSIHNYQIATRYGFRDLAHEWHREGCIEDFEQIDSIAYMVHLWLKYPKFGFQRVSDIASRRVREGLLSLGLAQHLIREHDHKLDRRSLDDFLQFTGYTHEEFWAIVERFWNRDLFENIDGFWQLREECLA